MVSTIDKKIFFPKTFNEQMAWIDEEVERIIKNNDNYNIKKAIQKEGKASYGVSEYTHTINRLFEIIKIDPKNKGVLNEVCRAEKELIAFLYDEPDALTEEKIHAYWNAYMQSFIAELENHPIHYVLVKGFDDRHNRGSGNIEDNNLKDNIEDIIEDSKENYTEEDVEDYIESIIDDKSSHNNEILGVYDSIARLQDAYIIALQKLEEQHKNMTGLLGNMVAYIVKNEKIMINVFDEFSGKWYYNVKTDRLFLER